VVPASRRAPSRRHVIWSIARRELGIASRRKIVRLLFLASFIPPLVMAGVLIARVLAKQVTGTDLGWDPVLWLLRIQSGPVALICLGLGTPSVARDRAEDVLYLYAVRPVSPWTYTAGKMLAVALPACLLLLAPSLLLAVVRQGIMDSVVSTGDSLLLAGRAAVVSVFMAFGFAGVCVGPSAITRRARWALLISLLVFGMFNGLEPLKLRFGMDAPALAPANASLDLMRALFESGGFRVGVTGALALSVYGVLGALITRARVREEMIP